MQLIEAKLPSLHPRSLICRYLCSTNTLELSPHSPTFKLTTTYNFHQHSSLKLPSTLIFDSSHLHHKNAAHHHHGHPGLCLRGHCGGLLARVCLFFAYFANVTLDSAGRLVHE